MEPAKGGDEAGEIGVRGNPDAAAFDGQCGLSGVGDEPDLRSSRPKRRKFDPFGAQPICLQRRKFVIRRVQTFPLSLASIFWHSAAIVHIFTEPQTNDPPVRYLLGTPRAKMRKMEQQWPRLPRRKVRDSVSVKLAAEGGEMYVLAKSEGRQAKEMAMRRKKLARLWWKLLAMRRSCPARDQLSLRIGAAKSAAGRAFGFVEIQLPSAKQAVPRETCDAALYRAGAGSGDLTPHVETLAAAADTRASKPRTPKPQIAVENVVRTWRLSLLKRGDLAVGFGVNCESQVSPLPNHFDAVVL